VSQKLEHWVYRVAQILGDLVGMAKIIIGNEQ